MPLLQPPDTAQETDLNLDQLDQAELAFFCALFGNLALRALANVTPETHSFNKERWAKASRESANFRDEIMAQIALILKERGKVIIDGDHPSGALPEGPIGEMSRLLSENKTALKDTSASAFFNQLGFSLKSIRIKKERRYTTDAGWLLLRKSRGDVHLHFIPVTNETSVQKTKDELRLWSFYEQRKPTILPPDTEQILSLSCDGPNPWQAIVAICLEQDPNLEAPWNYRQ